MRSAWEIYALLDPRDQTVRYIGITHCGEQRFRKHITSARNGERGRKSEWIRDLLTAGMRPIRSILQTGEGDGWDVAERNWIRHHREIGSPLTNITDGGQGVYEPSPEMIARRAALNRGRKDTPEVRRKKSAARIGLQFSPEHCAKISAGKTGKKIKPRGPFTDEHRAKLSAAKKGKKIGPRTFSAEHKAKLSDAAKRRYSRARDGGVSEVLCVPIPESPL